jgi:hypothetical protein
MTIRETIGGQFCTESPFNLIFPVETNALQCYHCGTDPAVQKPILLGALTRDPSYDYDAYEVPTCNYFNTSLSEYVITCQPDEKGCLKGWVTQVKAKLF